MGVGERALAVAARPGVAEPFDGPAFGVGDAARSVTTVRV